MQEFNSLRNIPDSFLYLLTIPRVQNILKLDSLKNNSV